MSNFEDKKLTKELIDKVRDIDGFPLGEDKNIIELSDPPFFTAFPNPFIKEYIKKYSDFSNQKDKDYKKTPYAADVSGRKNNPFYMAHSYSTKVPPEAIVKYVLHYTNPGDIIFDGFSGSGMTGIAAHMCESLNDKDKKIIAADMPYVEWGKRKTILCDLSPLASFISYNYNSEIDLREFRKEARRIFKEVKKEYGWVYNTSHRIKDEIQSKINFNNDTSPIKGIIQYVIWSDIFVCPECSKELIYWDVGIDEKTKKSKKKFHCTECNAFLTIRNLERAFETIMDDGIGKIIHRAKQVPVLINYEVSVPGRKRGKRYEKKPDQHDLQIIKKINDMKIPYWYPSNRMPEGKESRRNDSMGITHVHHFYTKRNFLLLSAFFSKISQVKNQRIRNYLLCWFTSSHSRLHKLNRYMPSHDRHVGPLSGTLYISQIQAEISPFYFINRKLKRHSNLDIPNSFNIITTQSSTDLSNIPSDCVDYIFTDPPFGSNLMYSELNFLLESWLKVFTNNNKEAIINDVQGKRLTEYQRLMELCFKENYRILKPGRWMTVEFHNSKNSVWIAIQEALQRAGFVIADVRTLDKQKGTTKQLSYVSGTVKQDLVISSYKPTEKLEKGFQLEAGSEEGAWRFIRQHLEHLPVYVEKDGSVEIIAERQDFLLYDRMIAFHVQRGITVPLSASEFYQGLKQRFPRRDNMYFTAEQVHEYDQKRMRAKKVEQTTLTIENERSAIHWLRHQLSQEPQTYQEIQPRFMQELHKESHEDLPELTEILEQNFLRDDQGRWYIPDNSMEADLEKIRERALLREFREYSEAKGRIRVFRTEAVVAGFTKCWQENDYEQIVDVAEKLPTNVLQENPTLLMYYDNALMQTQQ
jgi:DNA modification methylase